MKRIAWTFLGWLLLLSISHAGQPIADQERQKAHIVSRMYQATYGAQKQCINYKDEVAKLDKAIEQFRNAYPELMRLVDSSPYLPQAKEEFNATMRSPGDQLPVEECLYIGNMLQQWVDNPDGQNIANDMIETLIGDVHSPSRDKDSNQPPKDNDIEKPRAAFAK